MLAALGPKQGCKDRAGAWDLNVCEMGVSELFY